MPSSITNAQQKDGSSVSENTSGPPQRGPQHRVAHRDFQPPPSPAIRPPQQNIYSTRTSGVSQHYHPSDPRSTGQGHAYQHDPAAAAAAATHGVAAQRHMGEMYPHHMTRNHARNNNHPHGHNNNTGSNNNMDDAFAASDLERRMFWDEPLGSFGETDSPPRDSSLDDDARPSSLNPSPRSSPRYQSYPRYPPNFYGHHLPLQQQQPYGYRRPAPASQGRQPQYTSYQQGYPGSLPFSYDPMVEQIWNSPPPIEDSFAPPAPAPPSASPPRSTERISTAPESTTTTPEKQTRPDPFRSPAKTSTRSPVHGSLSGLGLTSSFGLIGSPTDPHMESFSPGMQSFTFFDGSGETPHASAVKPTMPRSSPNEFLDEFAGMTPGSGLSGLARSPMQSGKRRLPVAKVTTAQRLEKRPASGAACEVKPTKLWKETAKKSPPAAAPGSAMRLEFGHLGLRSSSTKKSLEGINNMMRAQQTPVATPRHAIPPSTSRAPYGQIRPQVPPHASRYAAPPQLYPGRPPAHHQTPQPSAAMNSQRSTSFRPKLAPITKRSLPTRKPTEQKASGKDAKAPPGSASKRNTCNCKKSRCLKMYCECFSAKNYCEGCKCKDCHNTPMFESHRERAIKDALSKNSSAFQQQTGGCRCKRSACLKKYCECFQGGELCNPKCKCTGCENRAGSQKLIDKRRHMKDTKGADYAIRVAEEVWKGQRQPQPAQQQQQQQATHPSQRVPVASPPNIGRHHIVPGQQHPHAQPSHGAPHHGYMHQSYMGPPMMGHIGYSPMGVSPATPMYGHHQLHHPRPVERKSEPRLLPKLATVLPAPQRTKRPSEQTSPTEITPRTPAVRIDFDPVSSRKKRKKAEAGEESFHLFGRSNPSQPKTAALAIFSFLSNSDLYNAALVQKSWSKLAMDSELWKFE